jgi:hypothetical protein
LKNRVLPPLTAGVFMTLDAAFKNQFIDTVRYGANNQDGSFAYSPGFKMPKIGDMVVYSKGHINIVVAVDPINKTFSTVGGNEGPNNNRNGSKVNYTQKYWSKEKIRGIISVQEQ